MKKPLYKRWWFIVIVIIVIIGVTGSLGGGDDEPQTQGTSQTKTQKKETKANVPAEYKAALESAENYSEIMHMSKDGIYDQLTS